MFKQKWYFILAWLVASFYFLMMMVLIVSIFSPGPSEAQAMAYMKGMMDAMHKSLMGWTMEGHGIPGQILLKTSTLALPAIFTGAILGIVLKVRRARDER